MKSRSIKYGNPGEIQFVEVDITEPQPWEVQVRGTACGICASDIYTYKNGTQTFFGPGHEGVGRVVKVGSGVNHLKVGDRVTSWALGFTSTATVNAYNLYKIPEESSLADEHWIVEPVACVVTGLDHCQLKPGDRIAVVGCGFMGLMLLQGLGRSYADEVIAIDIDPRRLELARQFGATRTLTPDEALANLNDLRNLSIDCVVDASGAQPGLDLSTKLVRRGGRINLFGWNHGRPTFDGDTWHMEGLTIVNSAPNSALRDPWHAAIRLLNRGILDLRPLVTHTAPLDEYPTLLQKAVGREEGYIKGVIKLG